MPMWWKCSTPFSRLGIRSPKQPNAPLDCAIAAGPQDGGAS